MRAALTITVRPGTIQLSISLQGRQTRAPSAPLTLQRHAATQRKARLRPGAEARLQAPLTGVPLCDSEEGRAPRSPVWGSAEVTPTKVRTPTTSGEKTAGGHWCPLITHSSAAVRFCPLLVLASAPKRTSARPAQWAERWTDSEHLATVPALPRTAVVTLAMPPGLSELHLRTQKMGPRPWAVSNPWGGSPTPAQHRSASRGFPAAQPFHLNPLWGQVRSSSTKPPGAQCDACQFEEREVMPT